MPAAQQDPKKNLKIGLAIGLLVVAGLVYAWSSGLFSGNEIKLPSKEEQTAAAQKVEQQQENIKKSGAVQSGAN